MQEKQKKVKNLKMMFLLVIGLVVLIASIVGITYAFFNYTRTGSSNVIRLGNIEFSSNYQNVVIDNVFPISSNEANSSNENVSTVVVSINGRTSYSEGIEYLVSAEDVNNSLNLPISISVSADENLGNSDSNYFDNRGGSSKIYNVLSGDTLKHDGNIVVGYIPSGSTLTSGNITITSYLNKDLIGISDTYDGTESDNMGTTNSWASGKTIITEDEWNSLSTNPISFKVRVEANDGIWVRDNDGNTTNPQKPNRFKVQSLYFTSEDTNDENNPAMLSLEDKSKTSKVTVKINNDDEKEYYATIKLQGNTSLMYDKKNYTITFYDDEDYDDKLGIDVRKGWEEQNKYVLKANWVDSTQSRNIVSARLAAQMQEKYNLFTGSVNNNLIDGFFVEIYINGNYQGLYTMNIPKAEWMFNMDKNNPNHIVMAAENPLRQTSTTFETLAPAVDGQEWEIEIGPKQTQEDVAATFTKLNRLISFVKDSTNQEFRNNLSNYMNLDALMNYYCFIALSSGVDNMSKNMLLVTYDGLVWYPSLYDLDGTWGLYYNGEGIWDSTIRLIDYYGGSSLLFKKLEECFPEELQTRYFELRSDVLSYENIVNEFTRFYSTATTEMWEREHTKWPNIPGQQYDINSIRTNLVTRINYMDSVMHALYHAPVNYSDSRLIYQLQTPYIGATFKFLDTGINLFNGEEANRHYTIVAKYKSNGNGEMQTILSNRSAENDGIIVRNSFAGDDEYATFWVGANQYDACWRISNDGSYVVMIATIDANVYNAYMDNTSRSITKTSSPANPITNNLIIGSDFFVDSSNNQIIGYSYLGEINYFAIYNEVLTSTEMDTIFATLSE